MKGGASGTRVDLNPLPRSLEHRTVMAHKCPSALGEDVSKVLFMIIHNYEIGINCKIEHD